MLISNDCVSAIGASLQQTFVYFYTKNSVEKSSSAMVPRMQAALFILFDVIVCCLACSVLHFYRFSLGFVVISIVVFLYKM